MIVLDSGALSRLAERSDVGAGVLRRLQAEGVWPPVVPTIVIAESTSGRPHTDAAANRLLRACDVTTTLPEPVARRAGALRASARRGSVVDAVVVALAEPGGRVLTTDAKDLAVLGSHAERVVVEAV